MRRYESLSSEQAEQFSDYIVSTILNNLRREEDRLVDMMGLYRQISRSAVFWKLIADHSSDSELQQVAEIIYKAENYNYAVDLHSGNIMWDSKLNTVVFTDPVA
jgi:hypothetical protein